MAAAVRACGALQLCEPAVRPLLLQVALAERFSERWAAAGLRSRAYSMHPGWTETEGVKTSIPGFYNSFKNKLRNLQQGCDTTVWLCVEVRRAQCAAVVMGLLDWERQGWVAGCI